MNNLKYFEDGLAYDFSLFAAPAEQKQENIIKIPQQRRAESKRRSHAAGLLAGKASAVLVAVFIVAMLAAGIFLRSQITEVEQEINKVNTLIDEADGQLARINFELEQKVSYKNLEASAKALGMKKVDKSQIVYIRTHQENKAVVGPRPQRLRIIKIKKS